MRGWQIALLAVVIPSAAIAQDQPYSEKRAAWETCVRDAAVKLMVPEERADTIAEGGFGSCTKQQDEVRKVIARLAAAAGSETAIPKIAAMMAEERENIKAVAIAAVLSKKRARL